MAPAKRHQVGLTSVFSKVSAAVTEYAAELAPRMHGDGRREDQLRLPVHHLVKSIGAILGHSVILHDEVALSNLSARPDIAVDTAAGRVGYIELKSPEKGVPDRGWRPSGHDRTQWEKFKDLPNLVYTNGSYWALYRYGVLTGSVGEIAGELGQRSSQISIRDDALEQLFRDFLAWKPAFSQTLPTVVREVAPLCRLLRDQVSETMSDEVHSLGRQRLRRLANDWRQILFPQLKDDAFADAYAQTVTFSLLLSRVEGISFDDRSLTDIANQLGKKHLLMGEALKLLTNHRWTESLSILETLRRVVGNISWADVYFEDNEAYSLLYERFLSEYDSALRRKSGTYYTPDPVAQAMVNFTDDVLKDRLGKIRGFASDDVVTIDPAMGTGTFLVHIAERVVATLRENYAEDSIPKAHLRALFEKRLVGFEIQATPFTVAEMRLHYIFRNRYKIDLPEKETRFLCDIFDDPDSPMFDLGLYYEVFDEARKEANRVKRDVPVVVVIGNPPWRERASASKYAPWLEAPRDKTSPWRRPSLDDFRMRGHGRLEFNLHNMWTFYWRWATWKAFEANRDSPIGVVTLITPKAYIASDSHAGMRRYLRETADEGWIIDLSPEDHRPSIGSRIFPGVQQPICIGVFARYGTPNESSPARLHYIELQGNRQQKFDQLNSLHPNGTAWRDCPTGWADPFRPSNLDWNSYPSLAQVMPWQHTGVNANRNWVWAPDEATLVQRWATLVSALDSKKADYFKETDSRSIDYVPSKPLVDGESIRSSIRSETSCMPTISRVAFRSFDRQYIVRDIRAIDRPRTELWDVLGESQVYASEQHTHPIADGPAISFSALIPNVDHFNGRGGRALPLYRDRAGLLPNITPGLLDHLAELLDVAVSPEDFLAYIAGVVSHPAYTRRFKDRLATPGVRVPLTIHLPLWQRALKIGREVIWLHTFGERFTCAAEGRSRQIPLLPPERRPRFIVPVSPSEADMPDEIDYLNSAATLIVGTDTGTAAAGRIRPVPESVWEYRVGGVQIVKKWFSYRQQNPARRRHTSPLDAITASRWTDKFDDELLELLNVIGRCVDLEPAQASILDDVCNGQQLTVADLTARRVFPVAAAQCKPPRQYRNSLL